VARQEAERLGRTDAVEFIHADFVSVSSQLPPASLVTLDRVVCCYPSYEGLLNAALTHAERCLALSYPRDGRVLAVDVEPKMVETLKQLAQKEKLVNVDVVQGDPNDPRLETGSVDAVLIVHAYHEMREQAAMLAHIRKALRPKGRLVIVEQITEARRDETREVQVKAHDLGPEYVVAELHAAGFRVERLDANFTTNPATRDTNWIVVATPATRVPDASRAPIATAR
jgi:SAM-dependent methyltransferase